MPPREFGLWGQYNQSAMKKTITLTLAAFGVLFAVCPLFAHHAFAAEFDANKPVKLEGTVVKIEMVGFTKSAIPVGTEVIFEGYQAKDGSHRANGRDITFPGGKKIFLGSSGPEGPPPDAK
jgi:hypothetical protein